MPHIIVQYSHNIIDHLDINEFLLALRDSTTKFPEAKIDTDRVMMRAYGASHFVATRQFPDAFIHIELRLLPGRPADLRKKLAAELQQTARAFFKTSNLKICVTAEPVELAEGYCASTES